MKHSRFQKYFMFFRTMFILPLIAGTVGLQNVVAFERPTGSDFTSFTKQTGE